MITSRDNARIREVKKLLSSAAFRREQQLFAIEGARLCADAATSGVRIRYALYTAEAEKNYASYLESVRCVCGDAAEISPALSKAVTDTSTPQGIFCVCEWLDNRAGWDTIVKNSLEQKGSACSLLALENIQDPANLGTMIRTAEAMGLHGLLLSEDCCDLYNPKVLRGSMGGVFRLTISTVPSMADTAEFFKERSIPCYACVVDSDALSITQAKLHLGGVCFIGNEGNGLRPQTVQACTARITIPMTGRAESLNAAMAAGIVMWEMRR